MKKRFLETLKEHWLFLISSLKHYGEVGMFLPSDRKVGRAIASMIPWETVSHVTEVGSGTGRITQALAERMAPQGVLTCVEKNEDFCSHLENHLNDPRIKIVNSAFEDLGAEANGSSNGKLQDCLVLSLAPALVSPEMRKKWVDVCGSLLKEGGILITQQFVPVLDKYLPASGWDRYRSKWITGIPPFRVDAFRKRSVHNN